MRIHHLTIRELLLHGVIIAVPFVLAFVLVLHRMAPSGTYTVDVGTLERSPYVNRILPEERAPADGDAVRIVDDPTYFTANIPDGGYDSVDVTVDFDESNQKLLELGALTDVYANSYDLRSLMNAAIDNSTWTVLRDKGRMLLDRTGTYARIVDFMDNPPSRTAIATYHDELDSPYRDPAYRPLGTTQAISVSLRGYHSFVTYVKNETLDMTVAYTDMNRTEGADDGAVRVWNEAHEVVAETRIADDGITSDRQENSGVPTTVHVAVAGLAEGVYTVELSGTSDIFWRRITTPQRYVTFVNQVYIADDVGYADAHATAFVTTAKHLTVETFHADSPRAITVGSATIALPQSHEKVQKDVVDPGLVAASTPVGDVRITGAGLFAFGASSFFNPLPTRMTAYTNLDAEGIDYVLAEYEPPTHVDGDTVRATANFDLASIRQSDGTIKFTLSAPGVADTDGIIIRRIRLDFHKPGKSFPQVLVTLLHRVL